MELSELFVSSGFRTLFELNFFAVFCCAREKFILFFFAIEALFHQDAKRVIIGAFFEAQESMREGKVIFFENRGCTVMYLARHFLYRGGYEFSQN